MRQDKVEINPTEGVIMGSRPADMRKPRDTLERVGELYNLLVIRAELHIGYCEFYEEDC